MPSCRHTRHRSACTLARRVLCLVAFLIRVYVMLSGWRLPCCGNVRRRRSKSRTQDLAVASLATSCGLSHSSSGRWLWLWWTCSACSNRWVLSSSAFGACVHARAVSVLVLGCAVVTKLSIVPSFSWWLRTGSLLALRKTTTSHSRLPTTSSFRLACS